MSTCAICGEEYNSDAFRRDVPDRGICSHGCDLVKLGIESIRHEMWELSRRLRRQAHWQASGGLRSAQVECAEIIERACDELTARLKGELSAVATGAERSVDENILTALTTESTASLREAVALGKEGVKP